MTGELMLIHTWPVCDILQGNLGISNVGGTGTKIEKVF